MDHADFKLNKWTISFKKAQETKGTLTEYFQALQTKVQNRLHGRICY